MNQVQHGSLPARMFDGLAVTFIVILAMAVVLRLILDLAQPLLADDIWWHVALGHVFLQLRGLPVQEPLLFTAAGHPQYYQEWLFQLLVAQVDRLGGMPALRALEMLLASAVMHQVYCFGRRQGFTPPLALVLVASLVLFGYQRLLQLRPELLAMLGLFALLNLYCTPRLSAGRVLGVLLITVLWSNAHATVMIVFPFLLAWLLTRAPLSRPHLVLLIAAFAAVALNPQGLRQYVFYFIHDANNPLTRVVDEWGRLFVRPAGLSHVLPWSAPLVLAAYLLVLGAVLVAAIAALRARNARAPHRILWAALALTAAAFAVRFLWLMPLAVAAVLPMHSATAARWGRRWALAALLLVSVHLYGGGTAGYAYPLRADALAGWQVPRAVNVKLLPQAVAAIAASSFRGRLLAPYELSGYLSYALHAPVKVYFNGRYDSYPRAVYDDFFTMLAGGRNAASLLQAYGVQAALLPADNVYYRLSYSLRQLGWCEGYHDARAVWLLAPATQRAGVSCDERGVAAIDGDIAARLAAGDTPSALQRALHHQRYAAVLEMFNNDAQAVQVRRAAASIAAMCALNVRLAKGLESEPALDPDAARQRAAEQVLCARSEILGHNSRHDPAG